MTRFRDQTGRPGPSTWELGSFPAGEADIPVGGISWYEAVAFARFSGKSLPTAYQWRIAADFLGPSGVFGDILVNSTFNAKGPTRVGTLNNIGPYGQYDMAGNVKEWCWNETRGGRVILGGGWNEPKYMYQDRDAQPAFSRTATHGMRLAQSIAPQPQSSYELVPAAARDYDVEKPIGEDAFAIVKGLYAYEPRPLNDRIETTEEASDWRRETITFDAVYGNERVILYLYVPTSAAPPYQTIVYFPGGDAPMLRSSRELNLANVDFLIRSGRALAYPVYSGTYERAVTPARPKTGREVTLARVKDFGRVVDYIATRRDLDSDRLGYYGVSLGATVGAIINAVDPRIKANVFLGGGLQRSKVPPEMDTLNFAPRMLAPTLMVNGASDFQFPLEGTQRPLFRLLSMAPDRKRHALFDGGHVPNQIHDVMREMLDWFDKFLGPVKTAANAGTN
jgi:dienelactone hydrolase